MLSAAVFTLPLNAAPETKVCKGCHELLPLSAFALRKSGTANVKQIPHTMCRVCRRPTHVKHTQKARNANSSGWYEWHRAYHTKKRFGVSADEYAAMLSVQGGVCAICKRAPETAIKTKYGYTVIERFAVDHDHTKARKDKAGHRGLLCGGCNVGLGALKDSVAVLRNAAEYLERYERRSSKE